LRLRRAVPHPAPEYNSFFTPLLKNTIDRVGRSLAGAGI
jgi:NAD(P)H-dependent FMN reductase